MQRFPCPFCGLRDETEFFFGAEAGKRRPDGAVAAESWAEYLYANENPKGAAREIWVHLTCGEFFQLERDTLMHRVIASQALHGGDE